MGDEIAGVQFIRAAEIVAIDRGNGIVSYAIASEANGAASLLTGMTVLPAGAEIPWHTHNHEECIVLLQGSAACETERGRTPLAPLDATLINADTPPPIRQHRRRSGQNPVDLPESGHDTNPGRDERDPRPPRPLRRTVTCAPPKILAASFEPHGEDGRLPSRSRVVPATAIDTACRTVAAGTSSRIVTPSVPTRTQRGLPSRRFLSDSI